MKKILSCVSLIFALIILPLTNSNALLVLELTRWANNVIPIAIVPFSGQDHTASAPNIVSNVVNDDLKDSGRFRTLDVGKMAQFPTTAQNVEANYWRQQNVDDVVVGSVQPVGGNNYKVTVSLVSAFAAAKNGSSNVLFTQDFTVPASQLRNLAHHISDLVYEKLLGIRGIFATHIAYVIVDRSSPRNPRYILTVADVDGFNPRPLLTSPEPIMSPAWSPDGRQLAYVSFENKRPQIYVHDVGSGQRRVVSSFPGINGAPAWSPDGRQLAVALSRTGHPKINIIDLSSAQVRQVTDGYSIDTEPSWSPDGRSLIFTSDRGGGTQIYQLNLASKQVQRLTYNGNFNAKGSFAPDGKSIIMMHRDDSGNFDIALQDLANGSLSLLTRAGLDDSPSVAPNGKMILYSSSQGRDIMLGIVSSDGNVKLRLPTPEGDVQSPAWSPFA